MQRTKYIRMMYKATLKRMMRRLSPSNQELELGETEVEAGLGAGMGERRT
jgi:hypothetical protein